MTDLTKCPGCGGEADNGHDRCMPPNVYYCTKCEEQPTNITQLISKRYEIRIIDDDWSTRGVSDSSSRDTYKDFS